MSDQDDFQFEHSLQYSFTKVWMSSSKRSPRKKLSKVVTTNMQPDLPPDAWQTSSNHLIEIGEPEDNDEFLQHFKPLFTSKNELLAKEQKILSTPSSRRTTLMDFQHAKSMKSQIEKINKQRKKSQPIIDSHSLNIIKGNSVFVCRLKSLDYSIDNHLPSVHNKINSARNAYISCSPPTMQLKIPRAARILKNNAFPYGRARRDPAFFKQIVQQTKIINTETRSIISPEKVTKLKTAR